MFNFTLMTTINAPIKSVFNYICEHENDRFWKYGTLATAKITDRRNEKGTYFRSINHFLGHRNLGTYEVTENKPNTIYAVKSIHGPLHLQVTYSLRTTGINTRVKLSVWVGPVKFHHMNERALGMKIKEQSVENLAVLKGLLESKYPPHRAQNMETMST